ncbi:L-threonylcarbamoyladenylate synthase [Oribacterium sp. WCC10]|uniref:L-threonylcarbamoyladenylate synthase n=1 Tax=Oribacterium sp. WCC10 TaxID=1855343 RepID=UPI0008E8EDF2|nr:L-threonylcarbamoyladenylate synthase [Oribacterium sp. WCC10]SFG13759.1 L-threonylcarbamoyladenylate synthase [Oribacterium sp. WCC10]
METIVKGMEGIEQAAEIIRKGGLVAFPTETVYGLGGNALDPEASRKIYAAKGRPSDNPLIVHVSCIDEVKPLVSELPGDAEKLMEAFWPGPLTIIMPKSDIVPYETTGGLDTVAVRCPENRVTLAFIKESGLPIAGPSANTSGKPSPTEAMHVKHDLDGKIDMILDDGPVGIGVESTIIDMSGEVPTLLRPGAITIEDLTDALGRKVEIDPAIIAGGVSEGIHPKAPGMKYRHYAPNARMSLVTTRLLKEKDYDVSLGERLEADKQVAALINDLVKNDEEEGLKVGIICCEETRGCYTEASDKKAEIKVLGHRSEPLSMTHELFRVLREFDDDKVERIYAESYSDKGVGFALMNRMRKAAGMNEIIAD